MLVLLTCIHFFLASAVQIFVFLKVMQQKLRNTSLQIVACLRVENAEVIRLRRHCDIPFQTNERCPTILQIPRSTDVHVEHRFLGNIFHHVLSKMLSSSHRPSGPSRTKTKETASFTAPSRVPHSLHAPRVVEAARGNIAHIAILRHHLPSFPDGFA